MENCILTFDLVAGREGKNVVLSAWKHPIFLHDAQVLEVERMMVVHKQSHKEFKTAERILKNWKAAWEIMFECQPNLEEYLELKEDMNFPIP